MNAAFIAPRLRGIGVRPVSRRSPGARIRAALHWRKEKPVRRQGPAGPAVPAARHTTSVTVHAHLRQIFAMRFAPMMQKVVAPAAVMARVAPRSPVTLTTRQAPALAGRMAPHFPAMAPAAQAHARLSGPTREILRPGAVPASAARAGRRHAGVVAPGRPASLALLAHVGVPASPPALAHRLPRGDLPPVTPPEGQRESSPMRPRAAMPTSAIARPARLALAPMAATPARGLALTGQLVSAAMATGRHRTVAAPPLAGRWATSPHPSTPGMTWRTSAPQSGAVDMQATMPGVAPDIPWAATLPADASINARIVAEAREAVRGELHSAPNLDRLATDLMVRIDKRLRIERERRGR
jgi:hypothetical protein